ncbi:MAG TPA: hypothetical protein VEP66_00445 [Myxococcales bacterium]|nr:hypothetical protein [Myxococcales bacterium]
MVGSNRHRDRNAILEGLSFTGGHGGSFGGAPRFSGFDQISFSARTHWEYSWRETSITNGEVDPEKSGVVRVDLANPVQADFGPAGVVTLFEATCRAKAGSVPAWWPQWHYLGMKGGALYAGVELEGGGCAGVLVFDSKTGETHPRGFMGWSPSGDRSVALGAINNSFLNLPAVVVDEPAVDSEWDAVGGAQIRDGELHDYQVREYYIPGKGFGGWYRRGTSIYSGGGYVDFFEIAVEVGLTSTSL